MKVDVDCLSPHSDSPAAGIKEHKFYRGTKGMNMALDAGGGRVVAFDVHREKVID